MTLTISEPDSRLWDAFVERHAAGHLLQLSGWGELKRRSGWEPRRVALVDPGDGALRAGAQVLIRRRLGLAAAYVPRGPLLSGEPDADALLLAELERLARRARAVFLRIEPNVLEAGPGAGELDDALRRRGFVPAEPIQPRSTIHLDLTPTPEQLLAQMSKGHRADIRRAAREGVTVRSGASAADMDAFYAIMQETAARANFAIHSRSYYHDAWELFGGEQGERALLLLAEREGRAVATCMVFAAAGAGLYLYGGSTDEGLRAGANHALQWEALRWARGRGARVYDFWGIPDALGRAAAATSEEERAALEAAARSDPLIGVYRFKKGFGGQVVRYLPAYDRRYIPPLYELWRRRAGM
ncbi:MAG: peptidoglycan bridge formation glycyltransferase FemA/FemB family protein [Chloroflexota bacterium]